jgi:PAS domain S-box-containing protein
MATEILSGDPLFVFDEERTILSWNRAAEELTGIRAADAVGKRCWEVLGGVDDRGALVCHPGCSSSRLAAEGWPVRCQRLQVKTSQRARRPVSVSTIRLRDEGRSLYIHVLTAGENGPDQSNGGRPVLTARQLEVLRLIDGGCSAKAIGARLEIAEATVRNHIRGVLLALGCHSQLEALAAARRLHLL